LHGWQAGKSGGFEKLTHRIRQLPEPPIFPLPDLVEGLDNHTWHIINSITTYAFMEEIMLKDLVLHNRSYRRFDQSARIAPETLRELCDLARLSSSGMNAQPLRYVTVSSEEMCANVFPTLGWAGYLKEWNGADEGERPAAYIVVMGDTTIATNFGIDPGIAMQSMMLGAVEKGLGGCIIITIKRDEVAKLLSIPAQYQILYVLALGKPVEEVVVEPLKADGDIKYWRDEQRVHHVPKRALNDLIISEK
jgi:nitroreductase